MRSIQDNNCIVNRTNIEDKGLGQKIGSDIFIKSRGLDIRRLIKKDKL